MKLRDLLKVLAEECPIKVYLQTEIGSALGIDCECIYSFGGNREVLQSYLDYFVVCVEEDFSITIKGRKIV